MNSNKSQFCLADSNRRSCNGCIFHKGGQQCKLNLEIECSVDGNYKNWTPNPKMCKKCVWSTDVGGKMFCLFIQGTCAKQ